MLFQDFGLDARVYAGIPKEYTEPTPIQRDAIPSVIQGKDVLGLAQTGTGKTAAFVLPILHRIVNGPRGVVRALIIAPTRELVEQINQCVQEYGSQTGLSSCTIYGGVNMQGQVKRLQRGVDIVVACPGRLLDHMARHTVDFKALEVLVLDEADQMFDMGFLPDLRRIMKKLPLERQNLLFSATMPKEIRHLTTEILRNPVTIQAKHEEALTTISHALYPIDQNRKVDLVLEILKGLDMQSVLIFTRTKHRAKRLGVTLERAGYKTASLQGNLSQGRRTEAMQGFRDGTFQVLVATDIAARGIDVQSVSHVINFDIPDTVAAYTHRIGRTGRAARTGDAFTFVSREDEPMVRDIERTLGTKIERRKVALPAQQHKMVEVARGPARGEQGGERRSYGNRPSSRPSSNGSSYGGRSYGGGSSYAGRSQSDRPYAGRSSSASDNAESSGEARGNSESRSEYRPQGRFENGDATRGRPAHRSGGSSYQPRAGQSGSGSYGSRDGDSRRGAGTGSSDRFQGGSSRDGHRPAGSSNYRGQRTQGTRSQGQSPQGQRSQHSGGSSSYRSERSSGRSSR
jgi:ATP-dependent RNA helicase RhlE